MKSDFVEGAYLYGVIQGTCKWVENLKTVQDLNDMKDHLEALEKSLEYCLGVVNHQRNGGSDE